MTDSAPRDPDQLASDLVDGLLPPGDAARLGADPQVAAHVARIEAVRSALRGSPPPPPPAGAIDRMVAAAVHAGPGSGAGSGPRHLQAVPPTPRHGAPPAPPGRSARPWLAAAAAVAVGLAMAGLLSQGGGSDSDSSDMATSAGDAEESAEHSDDEAAEAGGSGSDLGSGDASPEAPAESTDETGAGPRDGEAAVDAPLSAYVGSADSPEELADLVRAQRAVTPDSPPVVGQTDADACPGLRPEGDVSRGVAAYSADAEYQGTPVVVHVYESDGGEQLVATDGSCTDLVDVPFEE
jgi:hypothetical protein